MRILILFLLCCGFCEKALSQRDSIFNRELVSFVRQVRSLNKWNEKIVLINEPERRIIENWQQRKLLDDSFFSKNDKDEIQQQYSKSKKYKLQYIYSSNTTLVDSSKLMSVFMAAMELDLETFSQHTKSVITSLFQFLFS